MPEDILKLKLERLETIPNEFIDKVLKNQGKVFDKVIDSLNKLKLDESGNIIYNNENLALIKTLGNDFKQAVIKSGYGKSVSGFIKEFDIQKDLNKKFFEQSLDGFVNKTKYDKLYEIKQQQAVSLLAESAVEENIASFESILQNSIANSGSFTDLVKTIKINIEGDATIDGGLSRYAKQNARDIYSISERSYTAAVADEMGIVFWVYAGGKQDTTRPFCKERLDKVYHTKEIEAWASLSWKGKARGTDENTIFSLLGGYQCNHSLTPKGLKDVPISVIQRNIEKGNIKKSDLPKSVQDRL